MWVDKRPKSLDFKVQKSLKGLKKTKTKTLQSNTSVWNFRPPWKSKILKGNHRGKNRLSTGKNTSKITDFWKSIRRLRVNELIAMEYWKKITGEVEYCVQLNWNKATHWKNTWFQDTIYIQFPSSYCSICFRSSFR